MFWLNLVLATVAQFATGDASTTYQDEYVVTRATSQNFAVWSFAENQPAARVADACEKMRKQLCDYWSRDIVPDWSPGCVVVVHHSHESYQCAVRQRGLLTKGLTVCWWDEQGLRRRIDLLPMPNGELSALGHETTHLVLYDLLQGNHPPLWADEGAAILADSCDKQRLHLRDARVAWKQGNALSCSQLLGQTTYPAAPHVPQFYGQSFLLVQLLVSRQSPARFIEFLRLMPRQGSDEALRNIYGIEGLLELQRLAGQSLNVLR
jgi:hypothetical protein